MLRYDQLLLENKAWAQDMRQNDPAFFERLQQPQTPEILWIGCSDSRVSPDTILQTQPGEVFVHRNIANVFTHLDLNLFSVLQYAVEVLKVSDVIVCGHYGCGGVKAALTRHSYGTIDKWLRHIKDVHRLHAAELDALPEEARVNRLVELNVQEQLYNLAKTNLIQMMWQRHQRPALHGWVFDFATGLVKSIAEMAPGHALPDDIYTYDDLDKQEYERF